MHERERERNTNCLAGRMCSRPGCGSTGPFEIWTSAFVVWLDKGAGQGKGHQFTDLSGARCMKCDLKGTVEEVLPRGNPMTCNDANCDSDRFTAPVAIAGRHLLDGDGQWVEDVYPSDNTIDVDYDDLTCDVCGEDATMD